MSISTSVLGELLKIVPELHPQVYFKSSLTALSHAMEDLVLAGDERPLVIASFQQERFYRQEAHRYRRIADISPYVYVLSSPETEFQNSSEYHESIAFSAEDGLSQEWHLVIIGQQFATCLICREKSISHISKEEETVEKTRVFEGVWTFDRIVSLHAADILLKRILAYRSELSHKIKLTRQRYLQLPENIDTTIGIPTSNPDPFVRRLVTYLQAGQYKLMKANKTLAKKEHKERVINSVTSAIRYSFNSEEILEVAVQKLGEDLGVCRCIIYRCKEGDKIATINHEFLSKNIASIRGQVLPLATNPIFQTIVQSKESIAIDNASDDPRVTDLKPLIKSCSITSWLIVPVLYQGRLLGMVELHHCGENLSHWSEENISLVNAIATQVGVALIQAEAYANLEDLNEQLEALDRTRSNLVAITGHELRTPLSTIQVCLESLASEPDMPLDLREVMLSTALKDAERMRKLVQDFLTLSQLESGRVEWNIESVSIPECIDLAISNTLAHHQDIKLPPIYTEFPEDLALVQADGEWVVEVLSKLLDNACKFTLPNGEIKITVSYQLTQQIEVIVADTGRGIEPNRLETVFDRFYQEESALRRSKGGTGLGLAICRQIVKGWGGKIWAESAGKDCGSQFHFTLPISMTPNKGKNDS